MAAKFLWPYFADTFFAPRIDIIYEPYVCPVSLRIVFDSHVPSSATPWIRRWRGELPYKRIESSEAQLVSL